MGSKSQKKIPNFGININETIESDFKINHYSKNNAKYFKLQINV